MKKTLCILLSVLLIACSCVPVFAKSETETVPVIIVRGMDFNGLFLHCGTPEQTPCATVDAGAIVKSVFKGLGNSILHFGSLDAFTKPVIDCMWDCMGNLACDRNGNTVADVSAPYYPLSVDHYPELLATEDQTNELGIMLNCVQAFGAENTYFFVYDWRLDPVENAEKVNQTVEQAKADHHCDKVNIVCCSMGGIVTVAYLSLYGTDSVAKCLFDSSTFRGTYVATDLLNGRAVTDPGWLYHFLGRMLGDKNPLVTVLYKTGLLRIAAKLVNKFIEKEKDYVYEHFLRDVFGTMPALWALVFPEEYESAVDTIFPTDELKEEYAGLLAKTDRLQEMVRNSPAVLAELNEKADVAVLANYNTPLIPIYAKAGTQGDGTLETAIMAGGATVSDIGETLGEDYVPAKEGYLSPDGCIDASTAMFPDQTWFFKDAPHVCCSFGKETGEWLIWILSYDGQPTVHSDSRFPQFMLSGADETLRPF